MDRNIIGSLKERAERLLVRRQDNWISNSDNVGTYVAGLSRGDLDEFESLFRNALLEIEIITRKSDSTEIKNKLKQEIKKFPRISFVDYHSNPNMKWILVGYDTINIIVLTRRFNKKLKQLLECCNRILKILERQLTKAKKSLPPYGLATLFSQTAIKQNEKK